MLGVFLDNMSTGGFKLFLKGILFVFIGIILTVIFAGFNFVPESSVLTAFIFCAIMITFVTMIGYNSYLQTKLVIRTRKELKSKNRLLEETTQEKINLNQVSQMVNASLNFDDLLTSIVEILLKVSHFDALTVQLINENRTNP